MGKCLVKESFFEKETREKLYTFFADKNINFKAMELTDAPYVSGNAIMASGSRLLSLSLPVYKTLGTDEDGNFKLTLFVYAHFD